MRDVLTGLIVSGVGGLYTVELTDGGDAVACRARGVFRHDKITPTAGDFVTLEETDGSYVISAIHERQNVLIRPPVANLTRMLIVVPATKPEPDLFYVDKLTCIADALSIDCTVVVNKYTLDPDGAEAIAEEYRRAGFEVFLTDAVEGLGTDELRSHVLDGCSTDGRPSVFAFAGVSGAGKSSLAGRMFPGFSFTAGEISRKTERGRHTTREVRLARVAQGLYLADTPGFSQLDFERFDFFPPYLLPEAFREFSPLIGDCRYADCTHTKEEDCAVRIAMKEGRVSARRHESFCALYDIMKKKPEWQRRKEAESNKQ